MFKNIKDFVKEEKWFIVSLIVIAVIFNVKLPYYINMPGGTIKINDRIDCDKCNDINGTLNMLYVSETVANIPTYLLSYIIPNWDLENISEYQVNNESVKEINIRGKLMLENSIDSAMYVAYSEAGKDIKIKDRKNFIASIIFDNNLAIGDEIISVNGTNIDSVSDIKNIINNNKVGDKLNFKIKRNDDNIDVLVEIKEKDKQKVIGVVIVTDYVFDANPSIDIKFKKSESGGSGGLMMALSIYSKIADDDIIRGRNIAGTGTILLDGSVGSIDGIKYKIIGAVRDGMDVVLVPNDNYKDAMKVVKKYKYDIDIVPVKTFKDAINFLKK